MFFLLPPQFSVEEIISICKFVGFAKNKKRTQTTGGVNGGFTDIKFCPVCITGKEQAIYFRSRRGLTFTCLDEGEFVREWQWWLQLQRNKQKDREIDVCSIKDRHQAQAWSKGNVNKHTRLKHFWKTSEKVYIIT